MKIKVLLLMLMFLSGCSGIKNETYICTIDTEEEYFESGSITLSAENDILKRIQTNLVINFGSEELVTQALAQQNTLLVEINALSGVEATLESKENSKANYKITVNINDNNIHDLSNYNILPTEVGEQGISLQAALSDLDSLGYTCLIAAE